MMSIRIRPPGRRYQLILLLIATAYLIILAGASISALNAVNDFKESASAYGTGVNDTRRVEYLASVSAYRMRRVGILVTPIDFAGRALAWVPYVGDTLRAPKSIANVGEKVAKGSTQIIQAIEAFDINVISDLGTSDEQSGNEKSLVLNEATRIRAQANDSLAESQKSIDFLSSAQLIWPISRIRTEAVSQHSQVLEINLWIKDVLDVAEDLIGIEQDLRSISGSFNLSLSDGLKGIRDGYESVNSVAPKLQKISKSLNKVSSNTPDLVSDTDEVALLSDAADIFSFGAELLQAITKLLSTVITIIDAAEATDGSLVKNPEFMGETLKLLTGELEELRTATVIIETAASKADELSSKSRLSAGTALLDRMVGKLTPFAGTMGSLFDLMEVISLLFQEGQETAIIFLGLTSDELRASGGFTSSSWYITFDNGAIGDIEFIPILEADELDTLGEIDVPFALRTHMDARAFYLRDVGWSPDFPTVAQIALQMIDPSNRENTGAIVTLTQGGFVRFLDAIGGLETEEGLIGSEDVISNIETETDLQGTGYLAILFQDLVESLSRESLLRDPAGLATAVSEILNRKDMMIYSISPDTQKKLETAGWAGKIETDSGDRLIIVDSNVGWSKSDRVIVRSATYDVWLNTAPGASTGQLKLSYEHTADDAEATCDVQGQLTIRFEYDALIRRCYWNYVRVYPAASSVSTTHSPMPLPVGSIAARHGYMAPGQDTFESSIDSVGGFYAGLLTVEPGSTSSIEMTYSINDPVITSGSDILTYELLVSAQPGSNGRDTVITVHAPEGFTIQDAGEGALIAADTRSVEYRTDLLLDLTVTAIFQKR